VYLSKVANKFAQQLYELHESDVHIIDLFHMYMGFLRKFGQHTPKHDLRRYTKWQLEDMEMSLWNPKVDYEKVPLETVHNNNRRSGKTKRFSVVGVFCSLLHKEVKWRSAYMAQQNMAKFWFLLNPFVDKINNATHEVSLLGKTPYTLNMGVLTAANVTGVECDVAMFDEGGWVFQNLKLYEAYKNARPMVAPSKFKHIIHFSTPARYSAFQEAWLEVESLAEELGTQLTVLRTWEDCPWITPEFLAYEERMNRDCPWYVDQNYKGIWVVYGGAVFSNFYDVNDYKNVPDKVRELFHKTVDTHGGVDWNGPHTKHYLVKGSIHPEYLFIKEELKFTEMEFLKKYMNDISLELECDDPFSNQYANDAMELGIVANYFGWNMDAKMERVRQINSRIVIIDKKKCPTTWKNFQEAAFDQSQRLPTLEKRSDQHGLDGSLHMIHPKSGQLIYRKVAPMTSQMISGWNVNNRIKNF